MECKVEGCTDEVRVKIRGYCHKHYERWLRNGDPTVDGRALYNERRRAKSRATSDLTEKQCSVCKKVKPLGEYYSRGDWSYTWCKACHSDKMTANRLQKRLDNPKKNGRPPVDHGDCAFDGCTKEGKSRLKGGPDGWYCHGHWQQWDRNIELHPLRAMRKSHINDDFRLCTVCDTVKPATGFYQRTSGGKQSQCKECQVKIGRFNALMREGRAEDALTVAYKMPERVQGKYVERATNAGAVA